MRAIPMFLASLLVAATAYASDSETSPTSIRPFVGAYVPSGDQKKELSNSVLTGAQIGYDVAAPIRLMGSLGWTPSKDRDFSDRRTNIYQYDGGLELANRQTLSQHWKLRPFVGAGLGARSYSLKEASTHNQTDFDGYGAVGSEFDREKMGARLEMRDYLSRFKGVTGLEKSSTRNDLMLTGALTIPL